MRRQFIGFATALALSATASALPPSASAPPPSSKKEEKAREKARKQAEEDAKPQPKLIIEGDASDEKVKVHARAFLDRASMREAVGEDPGPGYIVVEVTLTPHADEPLKLDLDDFLLRSDKDGQHSRPMSPSQVAGNSVLVVKSVGGMQGRGVAQRNDVPYGYPTPGGYPGGGGVPKTLPGSGTPTGGVATADTSEASAVIKDKADAKKANPLLEALKAKQLNEGEYKQPVKGLLYFQIDGKVKPKHLELVYRKAPPRVSMRFVDPEKK